MRYLVAVLLLLASCDKGPPPAQVKAIQKYESEVKIKQDRDECLSLAHKSNVKHPADAHKVVGDAVNKCMREKSHRIPGGQK